MPVDIPPGLVAQRVLGEDWAGWLDGLPRRASDLVAEWELTQVAASLHGFCSLVLPVVDVDGRGAALKISFDGDDESEHEGIALQRWAGDGAVRLQRADPRRRALLLDWVSGGDLGDAWDVEACEVVGGLYARLHVPALPRPRRAARRCRRGGARRPPLRQRAGGRRRAMARDRSQADER